MIFSEVRRDAKQLFDYLKQLIIGRGRKAGQRLQFYPWRRRWRARRGRG